MVKPQYGHEKFSENCSILSPITSTATLPLVNLKAASSESNNLDRIPSFNTIRSTTTLISCFLFLSNSISSSTSWISPSTIIRTNPSFFTFSIIFLCCPFFPRTIGARICNLVLSGNSNILSTICSGDWLVISWPSLGQIGVPTLAHNNRKKSLISVTVPTVDLGFLEVVFWSIEIAGDNPSIESTSVLSICPKNWRAYAERLSTYLRCPSAYKVSNANELLPEPDKPVTTTNLSLGISTSIFFKLCALAPRIFILFWAKLYTLLP